MFGERAAAKKERVAKNEVQRLKNADRAAKVLLYHNFET